MRGRISRRRDMLDGYVSGWGCSAESGVEFSVVEVGLGGVVGAGAEEVVRGSVEEAVAGGDDRRARADSGDSGCGEVCYGWVARADQDVDRGVDALDQF